MLVGNKARAYRHLNVFWSANSSFLRGHFSRTLACAALRLRALCPVIALLLASCSWSPMYSPNDKAKDSEILRKIKISNIAGRNGQMLRNHLSQELMQNSKDEVYEKKEYVLQVALNDHNRVLLYNPDATAAREESTIVADVVLKKQDKIIFQDKISIDNSYSNIANNPHIHYLSQSHSFLLARLAQQIKMQIIAVLQNQSE